MKDRKYLLYLALPFLLIVGLILLGNVVDFSQYPRACFKTIKVTKPKYRQGKQRHENRKLSFHTG